MTFTYNDASYSLPDTLEDITLAQWSAWMTAAGGALQIRRANAELITEPAERDFNLSLIYLDQIVTALSYFSTIPLDEVQESIDIKQVLSYVGATELPTLLSGRTVVIMPSYPWGEQLWYPVAPAPEDANTFAAFKVINTLSKQMARLAEGDWSGVSLVMAAYLRGEDEGFDPTIPEVGSEREILMRNVPMSIAYPAILYLMSTLNSFITSMEAYAVPS